MSMRTRKQVRNFGQDITNYESICESVRSSAQESRKPDCTPNSMKNSRDERKKKKIKRLPIEDALLEDRVDQILKFGYNYFQDVLGQSKYISFSTNNCSCGNNRICEHQILSESHHSIFPTSPQLTLSMRNILVQWLVQVHNKMNLRQETLHLTIYLVDKFCCRRVVAKSQYQLLAMACLFIAGKYEEVATPKIKKIIGLCDRLYECQDVLKMQSEVLLQLNFKISQPSLNWFVGVELYAIVSNIDVQKHQYILISIGKFKRTCFYVTQLCLFDIGTLKKYPPQVISNTIIYTVSMQSQFIGINVKQSLSHLSPLDLKQVRECSPQIRNLYADRLNRKFDAINNKYPDLAVIEKQGE